MFTVNFFTKPTILHTFNISFFMLINDWLLLSNFDTNPSTLNKCKRSLWNMKTLFIQNIRFLLNKIHLNLCHFVFMRHIYQSFWTTRKQRENLEKKKQLLGPRVAQEISGSFRGIPNRVLPLANLKVIRLMLYKRRAP